MMHIKVKTRTSSRRTTSPIPPVHAATKTLEYHLHAEGSISIESSKALNSDEYPDLQRVDGLVATLQGCYAS